jgi:hypothetical protein
MSTSSTSRRIDAITWNELGLLGAISLLGGGIGIIAWIAVGPAVFNLLICVIPNINFSGRLTFLLLVGLPWGYLMMAAARFIDGVGDGQALAGYLGDRECASLVGDLEERCLRIASLKGQRQADIWYRQQVYASLPSLITRWLSHALVRLISFLCIPG